MLETKVANSYGAYYFDGEKSEIHQSRKGDLYTYTAFIGSHSVDVEEGDSLIYLSEDLNTAHWTANGRQDSQHLAVRLRGYNAGEKSMGIISNTNLPYVNGCSTRQIFPPERAGDPTFQQLTLPPFTSEQAHHIHSTVRVVYVLRGYGWSIVGQKNETEKTELRPGMVCLLDPMSPHHFETADEWLTVLPVHVFSSTGAQEFNHPMFNGTHLMNQGE